MLIKSHRFKNEIFFSKTVGLISISGVLILSASVVYDYGYFFVFDVGIAEMPTTLSDHLRSSLNWIPGALVLILYMLYSGITINNEAQEKVIEQGEAIEKRTVKKISEELNRLRIKLQELNRFRIMSQTCNGIRRLLQELNRSKRRLQKLKRPRTLWAMKLVLRFMILFSLPVSLLSLFYGIDWSIRVLQFSLMSLWINLLSFFYFMIAREMSEDIFTVSFFAPFFIIFMIFEGGIAADEIKKGGGNRYVFLTEKDETTSVLARTFDKHYMLWDEDEKKIKLLSMNAVIKYYPEDTKENPTKKRNLREEVKN